MPHLGELGLKDIPFAHLMHFSLVAGATNVLLSIIPKGSMPCRCRIKTLVMAVDAAPGVGKTVSFILSNGVDSMTVSVTGAETTDKSTDEFDVDVDIQDLTLRYTETAGSLSSKATLLMYRKLI